MNAPRDGRVWLAPAGDGSHDWRPAGGFTDLLPEFVERANGVGRPYAPFVLLRDEMADHMHYTFEGPARPELLAALLRAGRKAAERVRTPLPTQTPTLADLDDDGPTYRLQADGTAVVPNPAWPRSAGKRRTCETRAAHAGRARVVTALRRRARRRGVPATVRRHWTTVLPSARVRIDGDAITFTARGQR